MQCVQRIIFYVALGKQGRKRSLDTTERIHKSE